MRSEGIGTRRPGARWATGIGAALLLVACASAQREETRDVRPDAHYEKLIHQLELGMSALRELGRHDALEMLERVTDDVRRERQEARHGRDGPSAEREVAERHLEILRWAFHAFQEAEAGDAAERMEHAIHAQELTLEGRRDDEALRVRESAPGLEERVKLLKKASALWEKWGWEGRAGATAELARHYAERAGGGREKRAPAPEAGRHWDVDPEFARQQVKALQLAEKAVREAGRQDSGDLCKHAWRALEMQLEGRRDEEARHFVQKAPSLGARIELLAWSSKLYAEWGHEERAHFTGKMAAELKERWRRAEERRPESRDRQPDDRQEHIEKLHHRLVEMQRDLDELRRHLEELMHERRVAR